MLTKSNLLKNGLLIFMLLFIVIDLLTSSYHYYHLAFDGDITKIATPILWYEKVLEDPFGLYAFMNKEEYGGAGRYMCHETTVLWCRYVFDAVHFLVADSVVSIYLTMALFATCLHVMFLWLMMKYVRLFNKTSFMYMLLLICMATSFIQYNSYYNTIGIIDRSVSYAFFYALPLLVLALYYYFFVKFYVKQMKHFSFAHHILLIALSIYLSFSGALIQPIVFIVSLFLGVKYILPSHRKKWKSFITNKHILPHLVFMCLICLYAFYISKYNSEKVEGVPIVQRYALLMLGLKDMLVQNSSAIFMLILLVTNYFLMLRYDLIFNRRKYIRILFAIFSFVILYIALLPMGGYRSYRPHILRYDTIMPVTLLIVFLLVVTSIHIVSHFKNERHKLFYGLFLGVFISIFTLVDYKLESTHNECQKHALYVMKSNKDSVIHLTRDCTIGTWSVNDVDDIYVQEMLTKIYKQWDIIEQYQTLK